MIDTIRILAFAGSTRKESFNKKLVGLAAEGARVAGADVTEIDLRDYPMPLFGQDLEAREGMPETAQQLKQLFLDHQGFLIASPEYNSSVSAVLKNTIDWLSRAETSDEPPLSAFAGKVAVLMAASPGGLGGLRGLVHLRAILGNIRVLVLPEQRAVSAAHKAFGADGSLVDAKQHQAILDLGTRLVEVLDKLG
ncbi:MAG: NAD(P)H-dependent oxidoreductase [Acidobacteriota bacterium]|nr:NAD(P)H-dependent oxidoreductase [Acidobacteriota bacterium]